MIEPVAPIESIGDITRRYGDGATLPLTVGEIADAAAKVFGESVEAMLSPSRRRPLVHARQAAMYLARLHTDKSLPQIGHFFRRDHTTVIHALAQVSERLAAEPGLMERLAEVMKTVEGRRLFREQLSRVNVGMAEEVENT